MTINRSVGEVSARTVQTKPLAGKALCGIAALLACALFLCGLLVPQTLAFADADADSDNDLVAGEPEDGYSAARGDEALDNDLYGTGDPQAIVSIIDGADGGVIGAFGLESETKKLIGSSSQRTSFSSPTVFSVLPNPTTESFIASIAETARTIGQNEGLYASVMIAQAILESGSGSSGLSKPPYNNLFGIKGSYKGQSVALPTSEDDGKGNKYDITAEFRRYPSAAASLQDYANLLKREMGDFYAPAWKANARTYVQACDYLQGHYATDTTYSAQLQGIITAYNLTQYDYAAGQAVPLQADDPLDDQLMEARVYEVELLNESGESSVVQGQKLIPDVGVGADSAAYAQGVSGDESAGTASGAAAVQEDAQQAPMRGAALAMAGLVAAAAVAVLGRGKLAALAGKFVSRL